MFKYFPHTDDDLRVMMEKVGIKSLDELFSEIPENIRFRKDYDLLPGAVLLLMKDDDYVAVLDIGIL